MLCESCREFIEAVDGKIRAVAFRRRCVLPPPRTAHQKYRRHAGRLGRQDIVVETVADVGDPVGWTVRQFDEFLEESRIGLCDADRLRSHEMVVGKAELADCV